jgi:hypothetical protein
MSGILAVRLALFGIRPVILKCFIHNSFQVCSCDLSLTPPVLGRAKVADTTTCEALIQ